MGLPWEKNKLLLTDDTVLAADSVEELSSLMSKFGNLCQMRKLKINAENNMVVSCRTSEGQEPLRVRLTVEEHEEMK